MPLPHGLLPLYMTTDNFCEKLGSPLQKIFFYFTTRIFALAGGTGRKFFGAEPLPLSNGQMEAICLTIDTKKSKKRSACRHDRRFREAAIIRLCPNDPLCFSAITGRCRPLHLAAAEARRTPDTARSAAVRLSRDSSVKRPLSCGWTAPRKTVF